LNAFKEEIADIGTVAITDSGGIPNPIGLIRILGWQSGSSRNDRERWEPCGQVDEDSTLGQNIAVSVNFNFTGLAELGGIERYCGTPFFQVGCGRFIVAVKDMDACPSIHSKIGILFAAGDEFKQGALYIYLGDLAHPFSVLPNKTT
jgi:hypothetical protein